ncbi:MAG: tetratricopeptide repeat protein [Mediterranea sp.]|jgi:TolA-binding protein|nr:tetratricopeptide repeat protein [Mediterranea sp.]
MRLTITLFICASLTLAPLATRAQTGEDITSPHRLYTEGKALFLRNDFAAAVPVLKTFVRTSTEAALRQEAEYMLVAAGYELNDRHRVERLRDYLERYPDTPHANRIYALLASSYFYDGEYDEALALFNSTRLELLGDDERDERTYQRAIAYLQTGNLKEAAAWLETLRGSRYDEDCRYHIAYIRYTQRRYDEALRGFLPLEDSRKYRSLVPYYIAEIYSARKQYDKSLPVAKEYLSRYRADEHVAEMRRILGEAYYHSANYPQAIKELEGYLRETTGTPRRDALYMQGLAYYQTKVYSRAAETLARVTTSDDALTQNAYLHIGLARLELADKEKARLAFELAAASDADPLVKEQAAYNYVLCLHETDFSAFGESVHAFERFLNEFPQSAYTTEVSGYLVEVYMNTRSYDAALQSIDRITRPNAQILEAKQQVLFHLGTQAFANANFEQALGYLDRSIALGQRDRQTEADARYWRGETRYRLGRTGEAADDYNAYLRLTTERSTEMYALAHYNLGYIAFQRKDYPQAGDYFLHYTRLEKGENPEALADAYNRLGDCSLYARDFENAKAYYAQASQMDTASGDYSFYQLALVSGLQKDYSGKVTLLNRLIGKYPTSPYAANALYEKGRSYVLMGNNTAAIAAFQEIQGKYPTLPVARQAATETGLLYYQKGENDRAIAAYKQVIERYPGSDEARLALRDLKSIYVDLNRVDEFADLANGLPGQVRFDANEQDSLTYTAAERAYMRGRMEEAQASFDGYLKRFPDGAFNLGAHYYLCRMAYARKDYDQVLLHSAALLEYPDNPFAEEALMWRGEVLYNREDMAGALASYQLLKTKASNEERRLLAETGILRSAFLLKDDATTIIAANDLLGEAKLSPELRNEALYGRAKAYTRQNRQSEALADFRLLAKDTRNYYGAEAKYRVAQALYDGKQYAAAEKELLDYIKQSTPHVYWLARSFVLLSDVYAATGKAEDARQYLLSLHQNYHETDDIEGMIKERLERLEKNDMNQY